MLQTVILCCPDQHAGGQSHHQSPVSMHMHTAASQLLEASAETGRPDPLIHANNCPQSVYHSKVEVTCKTHHNTGQNSTARHSTAQHGTACHGTAQHTSRLISPVQLLYFSALLSAITCGSKWTETAMPCHLSRRLLPCFDHSADGVKYSTPYSGPACKKHQHV